MNKITRRAFTGSLAALAVAPLPTDAAITEDPILPLYREWLAAITAWRKMAETDLSWESEAMKVFWVRKTAAYSAALHLVPLGKGGIAALCHMILDEETGPGVVEDHPEYWEKFNERQNRGIYRIFEAVTGQRVTDSSVFSRSFSEIGSFS